MNHKLTTENLEYNEIVRLYVPDEILFSIGRHFKKQKK